MYNILISIITCKAYHFLNACLNFFVPDNSNSMKLLLRRTLVRQEHYSAVRSRNKKFKIGGYYFEERKVSLPQVSHLRYSLASGV